MLNVVNMILDYDLPSITPIDYAHVLKMKIIWKLSANKCHTPNISKLAKQTEIDRKTVLKYLDLFYRGELIQLSNSPGSSDSLFVKPKKIYLGNPNFMFSLCEDKPNTGTLRETFFCQQLSVKHQVHSSSKSDFLIDIQFTFEIGVKNKNSKQIEGIPESYVASDRIEYGFANHIPLGFLAFYIRCK